MGSVATGIVIVVLGVASLISSYANRRLASPPLAIINRWLRWISFSGAIAWLTAYIGWSSRPFWVLFATAFLLWLLLETIYNWLAIAALSQSPVPLFPKFSINTTGEEWPAISRIINVRDWLRKNGYKPVQPLLADIGNGIQLRVSVYQDPEAKLRVQVLFIPINAAAVTVCFSVASETESGMRYITDNLFLPFGGFYPENWSVERRPWIRRLDKLVRRHLRRIEKAGEVMVPWESDPLEDLNEQQRDLDRLNTELGFLYPPHLRDENGKMTFEGRYRVWKEVWMLNYLGRPYRY